MSQIEMTQPKHYVGHQSQAIREGNRQVAMEVARAHPLSMRKDPDEEARGRYTEDRTCRLGAMIKKPRKHKKKQPSGNLR